MGLCRHAEELLAHGQLVVVDPRLPLPGLKQPRCLPVDAGAVQALVTDACHVEDALAQDTQVFKLFDHPRKHRFGQAVQLPEQGPLPSKQGECPLLAPGVGNGSRQSRRHERRRLPEPPALGAVGVRQSFFEAGLLKLV